jgi:colicin import membrane protein
MKQAAEVRVAAEKVAAEEARKAVETARLAEAERKAAEARQAEHAAWAAEEARRADQMRKAEEIRKAEDIRKANEALRLASERAAADNARRAEAEKRDAESRRAVARATAEEMRRVTDNEADAEIARVAERLSRIRAEHLARHSGTVEERTHEPSSGRGRIAGNEGFRDVPLQPPRQHTDDEPHQGSDPKLYAPAEAPKYTFDGRVTVVLQMEPRYRRGRRYESMDPVLCVAGGCYVSNGADEPSTFLHGHRAIRFGNAIGRRAGDCNSAYTCVFRNVDLGALPAEVQPVDIRVLRHDLRAAERVDALSNCRIAAGERLACTGAIHGDGFTMLVISEDLAERLPPHAFESVLAGGFTDNARAEADLRAPRRRW